MRRTDKTRADFMWAIIHYKFLVRDYLVPHFHDRIKCLVYCDREIYAL
jgi:hypothetical protein